MENKVQVIHTTLWTKSMMAVTSDLLSATSVVQHNLVKNTAKMLDLGFQTMIEKAIETNDRLVELSADWMEEINKVEYKDNDNDDDLDEIDIEINPMKQPERKKMVESVNQKQSPLNTKEINPLSSSDQKMRAYILAGRKALKDAETALTDNKENQRKL